ncbi:MAG: hypothetical protein HUK15_08595, partial [Bacteroidales bacterium]|nr:hypothetical protein [Bacteroidales bacterium]
PIVYDNVLYFSYNIAENTKVLSLNANSSNQYLDAVFSGIDENIVYNQAVQGREGELNINDYDLVVLNSFTEISSGLSDRLNSFVANGGSVCLIPGKKVDYNSFNAFLDKFAVGKFLGGFNENSKLYDIDFKNDLYRNVFSKEERQTNLPVIDFSHQFKVYSKAAFSSVLSLENSMPVLVAGNYGNGKLYIFTTPIENINSDFCKSVTFSPAMFNMAMNSQLSSSLYTNINTDATTTVRVDNYDTDAAYYIADNFGGNNFVDVRYNSGLLNVFVPNAIKNAGTYSLCSEKDTVAYLSMNYNRQESMQDYLSLDELEEINKTQLNGRAKIMQFENLNAETADFMDVSDGKPLWIYFVLLAFLFIVCEILFIKFLK